MLEQILYQVVGMAIVLGSLGILALGCGVMGLCFSADPPAVLPKKNSNLPFAPQSGQLAKPSFSQGEITPQEQAAIVAAVYVVCGNQSKITEIELASTPQPLSWSLEGRRQIFQSHRIR